MRKQIGVFVGEPGAEYQRILLKGIFAEGERLGYDVYALCSYGEYGDNVLYAEGEKAIMYLPDLKRFDGIIVAQDTFDIDSMESELAKVLKKQAECPVIYLRKNREEFYSVIISDRRAMADMTRHFIQKHGFRDICFMQGRMSFQDAQQRYQGFLDAMDEAGIPVTEHMVFEGDYWRGKGKAAVDWYLEGRDTYPQVIICSNDYMALAVCEELQKRGIRVPEDICVSGYDHTMDGRRNYPSITSMSVEFGQLGARAVQMIDRICNGLPQQKVEIVDTQLRLYKSCGCGEQVQVDNWPEVQDELYRKEIIMKKLLFMAVECQDAYDEEEYLRMLDKYFPDTRASKGYLVMCEEPEGDTPSEEDENTYFTDTVVLKCVFEYGAPTIFCNEPFQRAELLPEMIKEQKASNNFIVLPIHYKNRHFGYMVLMYDEDKWIDGYIQSYLATLANVIDAAEIHKRITGLEEIRNLYLMDALTGIYNRRGFEKQLRQKYEQREHMDADYLSVVSIDMDGLKYINDTFGHVEGDVALCNLAQVLKNLMQEKEVCARVGGDEFFALLVAKDEARHENFAREFKEALQIASKELNKPYALQASVGICCITQEQGLSLMGCLQKADREMYTLKKKSKAARK